MRVFILGVDGYLGWSLAQYLAHHGHIVSGIDNLSRRLQWTNKVGSDTIIPIKSPSDRIANFREVFGSNHFVHCAMDDSSHADNYYRVKDLFVRFEPDCIVNLAQMPSAPYSMIDHEKCYETHMNNIGTTLALIWAIRENGRHIPIVTIGTAGEYGTPGIEIAEGYFEVTHKGRTAKMLFPRMTPASFYHATKCHSSIDIERACAWWGLSATDIMQSVVYGTRHQYMACEAGLNTRFDIDEVFGTAINRFVAQAVIGHPLTVYGDGTQKRGFLSLRDSMECLRLIIEHPPEPGEYRVVNQYDQIYQLKDLAQTVKEVAKKFDIDATVQLYENPRFEQMGHFYSIEREKLLEMGYIPKGDITTELEEMFLDVMPHKDIIEMHRDKIVPATKWM
jgi:nucleoside-diphosphate-sugar epimerase